MGCPVQLTRTTTIPHGPLDILQAQEQVRHRGSDRHAHRGSNPGGGEQVHDGPQQLNPQMLGTHEGSNQGSGSAKPAKATELQAPCVLPPIFEKADHGRTSTKIMRLWMVIGMLADIIRVLLLSVLNYCISLCKRKHNVTSQTLAFNFCRPCMKSCKKS